MRRSSSCELSSLKIIPSTANVCSQLHSPRPHWLLSKPAPPAQQQQQQQLAMATAAANDADPPEEESSCAVALCLDHVLENILSNLPYWNGLGPAARVCQQWSKVAARVTADEGIDTNFQSYEEYERYERETDDAEHPPSHVSLVPWLSKHGHSVPSITLCSGVQFSRQYLPEPAACFQKLTSLTSLKLCCMNMTPDGLSSLAGLKELRSLTFRHMYVDEQNEQGRATALYNKSWQQVWVGCPQLTYVQIECSKMHGEALKGVGALQHLQELILIGNPLRTAAYLNPLPPNLTALRLKDDNPQRSYGRLDFSAALSKPAQGGNATDSSASMPQAGGNLLALHITDMDLREPSLLSSLTSLTALDANSVQFQKPRDLLAVLPCLRQLRHLDLSTKDSIACFAFGESIRTHDRPGLGTEDFARLVAGCPDLESIAVAAMPQHYPWDFEQEPCSFLGLQGATRLTRLTLWANERLQDTHFAELATLTGLKSLAVFECGSITDAGVQELTQLTGLTHLLIDASGARKVSKQVASGFKGSVSIKSRSAQQVAAEGDAGGSVSQQLARCCACSSLLHPCKPGAADAAKPRPASDEVDSCGAESESESGSPSSPTDSGWERLSRAETFYKAAVGEGDY